MRETGHAPMTSVLEAAIAEGVLRERDLFASMPESIDDASPLAPLFAAARERGGFNGREIDALLEHLEVPRPIVVLDGPIGDRSGLVAAHRHLLEPMVSDFRRSPLHQGRPATDAQLFDAALDGLAEAAENFDPRRGNDFAIYARWWVRQALARARAAAANQLEQSKRQ